MNMFSFHKPKVYRSLTGCCICKAKSSSSRFTDSQRYECEFERCFRIRESRQGEICNACVLLVKRWKKLPKGTNRHWNHVVDARAGPGTKSTLKMKNKMRSPPLQKYKSNLKHRRVTVPTPPKKAYSPIPSPLRDELISGCEENSNGFDEAHSSDSDESDTEMTFIEHRALPRPTGMTSRRNLIKRKTPEHKISPFLDLTYWKRTVVCCGIVFIGENNDLLVDPVLYRPCWYKNKQNCKTRQGFKRSSSLDDTDSNASSLSESSSASMDCNSDYEYGPESPPPLHNLLTDHDSKVNIAARLACLRSTKMEFDGDIIKC